MRYVKPEETNYIENKGDVLACKFYHIMFTDGRDAISNAGIQNIDNKNWEIFWVNKESELAYYGSPAEGFGLVDCMILKTDTRDFLQEEIQELENHYYQLGDVVQKVKIEPIVEKWKNQNDIWIKQDLPNEEGYYAHICPKCKRNFWYKAKRYYDVCQECKEKGELQ